MTKSLIQRLGISLLTLTLSGCSIGGVRVENPFDGFRDLRPPVGIDFNLPSQNRSNVFSQQTHPLNENQTPNSNKPIPIINYPNNQDQNSSRVPNIKISPVPESKEDLSKKTNYPMLIVKPKVNYTIPNYLPFRKSDKERGYENRERRYNPNLEEAPLFKGGNPNYEIPSSPPRIRFPSRLDERKYEDPTKPKEGTSPEAEKSPRRRPIYENYLDYNSSKERLI